MPVIIHALVIAVLSAFLLQLASRVFDSRLCLWKIFLVAAGLAAIPQLRLLFAWDSLPYALFNLSGFLALPFVVFYFFQGSVRRRMLLHACLFVVIGVCDVVLTLWVQYGSFAWQDWIYGENGMLNILGSTISFGTYIFLGTLFFSRPMLWVVGFFITAAVDIILGIYLIFQDKRTSLEKELQETRHVMELEEAHYREIEKRQGELAHIRHDFNNQLAAIAQLVSSGKIAAADDMMNSLSEKIAQVRETTYCDIPIINAVLTEKEKRCAEMGIKLVVQLAMPEKLAVEQLHLCSIFSNLMDNAIAACEKVQTNDQPVIWLSSKVDGDYLFIKVVNPSSYCDFGRKPTSGHGYGTKILSTLAERYEGAYQREYSDGLCTAIMFIAAVNAR